MTGPKGIEKAGGEIPWHIVINLNEKAFMTDSINYGLDESINQ
jgi:hypothetical protein